MVSIKKELLISALLTILLGLCLAILAGTTIGYPLDPEGVRATQAELNRTLVKGKAYSSDEMDRILESAAAKGGPTVTSLSTKDELRAILNWHPLLVWAGVFLVATILRPNLREFIAVGTLAAILLGIWAGVATGSCMLLACIAYSAAAYLLTRLRNGNTQQRGSP